jgi:hypothetical protein
MLSQSLQFGFFALLGFVIAMLFLNRPGRHEDLDVSKLRISDSGNQAHTGLPTVVTSDAGQPLYMQRPAGSNLQLVAAGHSSGGPP